MASSSRFEAMPLTDFARSGGVAGSWLTTVSQERATGIERQPCGRRHRKRTDRPAVGRVLQARIPDHLVIDQLERLASLLFRVFDLLVGIGRSGRCALVRVEPAHYGNGRGDHGKQQGRQCDPPRQLRRMRGGRRIFGFCRGRRLIGRCCGVRLGRRVSGGFSFIRRGGWLCGRRLRHWSMVSSTPDGG